MYCTKCGSTMAQGEQFCNKCGSMAALSSNPPPLSAPRLVQPAIAPYGAIQRKPKRMHGCLIALLVIIGVIVLLGMLFGAALLIWGDDILRSTGLMPRDLGVRWTQKDYDSFMETVDVETGTPPASTDRSAFRKEFIGTKDVDWSLSESEMTAWMNKNRPGYWPFTDVQVKFHDNNIIEVSGYVNLPKLFSYPVFKSNLDDEILDEIMSIPINIPVYMKGQADFSDPRTAEINLQDMKVTGIEIPSEVTGEYGDAAMSAIITDMVAMADQVRIDRFQTSEGKLDIAGTWYEEMKRIPVE